MNFTDTGLVKKNNPKTSKEIEESTKIVDYSLNLPEEAKEKLYGKIRRNVDIILNDAEEVSRYIKNNIYTTDITSDLENLDENTKDIIDISNDIFFKSIEVLRMIGDRDYNKSTLPPIIKKDESVAEVVSKDILHFSFPELLPKRIKPNSTNYNAEYKRISLYYERFFSDFFEELNSERDEQFYYKEKVSICFIHHFSSPHLVRDHDNFEIKRIIDCIAFNCLPNDSAAYCSHYSDYIMDKTNFSEIYVVPEKKLLKFLNNFILYKQRNGLQLI